MTTKFYLLGSRQYKILEFTENIYKDGWGWGGEEMGERLG